MTRDIGLQTLEITRLMLTLSELKLTILSNFEKVTSPQKAIMCKPKHTAQVTQTNQNTTYITIRYNRSVVNALVKNELSCIAKYNVH